MPYDMLRQETAAKAYINTAKANPLTAARLGTIALVSLVRSSEDSASEAGELIQEIREAILSSAISKSWAIEKITILGESDALAAGLSQTPPRKNSTAP